MTSCSLNVKKENCETFHVETKKVLYSFRDASVKIQNFCGYLFMWT